VISILKKIHLKYFLIAFAFLVVLSIGFILFSLDLDTNYYMTFGWIALIIALLWIGNTQISKYLDNKLPWLEYGTFRFFSQLASGLIYSLLVINISYLSLKSIFTSDPPSITQIIVMNTYGVLIIIPVISIYFGFHFLRSWRKSELEAEKYQKESIKSQLEALKNHLDPHFLFNNLNILSSLIDKDKDLAQAYLEKFAEIYRIILQSNVTEVIPLSKEMEFIDAYIYLIKIRFDENIEISSQLDNSVKSKMLPPLTLQMLVENAIKHNIITESKPLKIEIYSDHGQYLIVKNNLNPKPRAKNDSGSGLENIENRYAYFTNEKINIKNDGDYFTVEVPLIEVDEI